MDATIQTILAEIPLLGGKPVSVRSLEGGLTNRNFVLDVDGEQFVLRIPGANTELLGIDRHFEHACTQATFAAGIGAEVIAFLPEHGGAMVTRFMSGEVLPPEAVRTPATLERVVVALRLYHESQGGSGHFSTFETVYRSHALAQKHCVKFPAELDAALGIFKEIEAAVGIPEPLCPCHNDLVPGNLIDHHGSIRIIDWEFAGQGDRFFDLGNLAANQLFDADQERLLLQFYFGEIRPSDLHRLRLMRRASDMREAMWGFLQMGISKLDIDYAAYAHFHLQRFLDAVPHP